MPIIDQADIEAALDQLRPGLDSDGFRLDVGEVRPDGRIVVTLKALPNACLDCLIPDDLLTQMVQVTIRDAVPGAGAVELVKVGFEGQVGHS